MKPPSLTLDSSLVQDNIPIEIIPKVFIGSIHAAFNHEALHEYGITHILNASRLPPSFPKSFTYLSIDLRDKESANILSCIPAANIFIEAGVDAGGVLVHCFGGRSRSAAFVAAYMISCYNMKYDEAISKIKIYRQVVSVNQGFEIQLSAYSQANCNIYLAQQLLLFKRIQYLKAYRGNCDLYLCETGQKKLKNVFKPAASKSSGQKRAWEDVKIPIEDVNQSRIENDLTSSYSAHSVLDEYANDIPSSSSKKGHLDVRHTRENNQIQPSIPSILSISTNLHETFISSSSTNSKSSPDAQYFQTALPTATTIDQSNNTLKLPQFSISSAHPLPNSLTPISPNRAKTNSSRFIYQSNSSISPISSSLSSSLHISPFGDLRENGKTNPINSKLSKHEMAFPECQSIHLALRSNSTKLQQQSNRERKQSTVSKQLTSTIELNKSPYCRLSIPGNKHVRIIPPLRGLERSFCCSWCNSILFCLANVVRLDLTEKFMDYFQSDIETTNTTELQSSFYRQLQLNDQLNKMVPIGFGELNSSNHSQLKGNDADEGLKFAHVNASRPKTVKASSSSKKSFTFDCVEIESAAASAFIVEPAKAASSKRDSSYDANQLFPPLPMNTDTHPLSQSSNSTSLCQPIATASTSSKMSVIFPTIDIPPLESSRSSKGFNEPLSSFSTKSFSGSSFSRKILNVDAAPLTTETTRETAVVSSSKGFDISNEINDPKPFTNSLSSKRLLSSTLSEYNKTEDNSFFQRTKPKSDDSNEASIGSLNVPLNTSSDQINANFLTATSSSKKGLNLHIVTEAVEYVNSHEGNSGGASFTSTTNTSDSLAVFPFPPTTTHMNSRPILDPSATKSNSVSRSHLLSLSIPTDSNITSHQLSSPESTSSGLTNPLVFSLSQQNVLEEQQQQNIILSYRRSSRRDSISSVFSEDTPCVIPTPPGVGPTGISSGQAHGYSSSPFGMNLSLNHSPFSQPQSTSNILLNTTSRSRESSDTFTPINIASRNSISPDNSSSSATVPSPSRLKSMQRRPSTVEKQRWLDRINLLVKNSVNFPPQANLHATRQTSPTNMSANLQTPSIEGLPGNTSRSKISQLADDDDAALDEALGKEKYIYLEYLSWMGTEIFEKSDTGLVKCYGCNNNIGVWTWSPNERQSQNGKLISPIIRVMKKSVHETALAYDPTPACTPRANSRNL